MLLGGAVIMENLARSILGENYEKISSEPLFALITEFLQVGFIVLFTLAAVRIARAFFKRARAKNRERGDQDQTQLVFLGQMTSAFIYICGMIGIIYQFETLRTILYSVLAGSGVAAIIIGFASQEAAANIISGILITLFRPFKIGDFISLGAGSRGTIETITLRHIIMRTPENRRLVVPNSLINKEIIENSHYHDQRICNIIEFFIDVSSNIDRARFIIKEEIVSHPSFYDNGVYDEQGSPTAVVRVTRVEPNYIVLSGYAWAKTPWDAFVMKCELLESVKKRFDAERLRHPYSQRVMLDKNF
jgi:small conductance mechanosensitive channel